MARTRPRPTNAESQPESKRKNGGLSRFGAAVATAAAAAALAWWWQGGADEAQSGVDRLVASALGRVLNSTLVNEVAMDLPEVSTPPFRYMRDVGTLDFMDVVNASGASATEAVLVAFFDPRSESFLVTRNQLEKAAKALGAAPDLKGRAQLAAVNVAVHSYLQSVYSPETLSSWQENEPDTASDGAFAGFLFGKRNYFPLIIKLFRKGKPVAEFAEAVRPSRILHFLRRHLAPNHTELPSAKAADEFLAGHLPAAIACVPNALPPAPGACEREAEHFQKLTGQHHGWLYYGYLRDANACAALSSGFGPCQVLVASEDGVRRIFSETVPGPDTSEAKLYRRRLVEFIGANRDESLVELTPDNSWDLIRVNHYLVILLADPQDQAGFSRARAALNAIGAKKAALEATKLKVKFAFANGRNFAAQFGIPQHNLPNVVLFDTVTEVPHVYSAGEGDSERPMLLAVPLERAQAALERWVFGMLRKTVASDQARSGDEAGSDKGPVADLSASTGGDRAASRPADSGEARGFKTRPAIANRSRKSSAWREIRKLDPGLLAKSDGGPGHLWETCLGLYQEILLLEESYANMSPERRARPENVAMRRILDAFFRTLETRTHLRLLVNTLPRTPADLAALSRDSQKVRAFWRDLQRLSAFKEAVLSEAEAAPQAEATAAAYLIAQDVAFMYNSLVDIFHQRTSAFERRFRAETSRAPAEDDLVSLDIERRDAKDLSVREFVNEFAKKRKPVIISGLKLTKVPWTKEHIAERCGRYKPTFVKKDDGARTWGGLVGVRESVNLTAFLRTHTQNETRRAWYLHDWGLPINCPEIMGPAPFDEFTYPRYFAGDYFQRMPFVGYQHSWPSLFVGANGTESKMHVDSGGTNFWMYLMEGEKEWRFYDRFDTLELYPEPGSSHFFHDVFRPDLAANPLVVNAPMYKGLQRPGDLIFIPGGCPHGVRNLGDIVGVSMNYLDVSNEWLYLWMQLFEEDYRDYELYANPSFPRGLRSDQQDLTLGEFKSHDWYKDKAKLDLL